MSEATRGRLFGWSHAFDHPAVPWMTAGVAVGATEVQLNLIAARWLGLPKD